MAGKTDMQILKEAFELYKIDHSNGIIPEFYRNYVRLLREHISKGSGHIKPGIREALRELQARKECILGLLTGNIEEGARVKLDFFGLNSYFSIGAFGSDDEDRNKLLPIAVDKLCQMYSVKVGFRDCVVIGDTPRDISCSKPYGAFSIAVATGPYSAGTLSAAGADFVFDDLSNTEAFLSLLKSV
jgi:phosphoglycolate phosphatase-like HAD superfamily hydrolase